MKILVFLIIVLALSVPFISYAQEPKVYTDQDLRRYRSESDNGTYIRNNNLSEDKSQPAQESIPASNDTKLEEHCSQSLRDNYKEFKSVFGLEAYTRLLSTCRGTKEFSVWCDKALGQIKHPIKYAATAEAYASLLSVCHGSGEISTSHRQQNTTNSGAKNQFNDTNINKGAINTRTGEYYPGAAGGIINPKTGQFYPDVGGGYINPKTGEFMPKQ